MKASLLLLAALSAGQAPAQLIWTGHAATNTIEWSAKHLRVYNSTSKAPVLNIYSYLSSDFRRLSATPHDSYLRSEHAIDVKSLVGNYLSIGDVADLDFHGPHEDVSATFQTFDLQPSKTTKTDKPVVVKLTDIFPENAVYQALLEEKTLAQVLTQGNGKPADLAALLKALDGQDVTEDGKLLSVADQVALPTTVTGSPLRYHLTAKSPNRFAFYDYSDGIATVHLCLDSGWTGHTLELAIKLEVPERLRPIFQAAHARTSGFLMKDRNLIARPDATTVITFSEKH